MRELGRSSYADLHPTGLLLAAALVTSLLIGCAGGTASDAVAPPSPQPPGGPTTPPAPPAPSPPRPLAGITGRVAFASNRDGATWIYVADSSGVRRLVPGDEPSWSPDGRQIAYASPNGISVIDADGGNQRLVRSGGLQPSWSPDGTHIAYRHDGIRVMDVNGSADHLVVDDDFMQQGDELHQPDWSLDGRTIAFVRYDCCWMGPVEVYVVGFDGKPPRAWINGVVQSGVTSHVSHWAPAWAPDGKSLALIYDFGVSMSAGLGDVRGIGVAATWESDLDWSPDGRRLVYSHYDRTPNSTSPPFTGKLRLFVADLATGEVRQLIPDEVGTARLDYWDNNAVWTDARP